MLTNCKLKARLCVLSIHLLFVTRNIFKKEIPRMKGSECCYISYQKKFKICLSEIYHNTQNLTPFHYKTPLLHPKNPQNKKNLSEDLTIAPPQHYHWTKIYSGITLLEKLMVLNNPNIDLIGVMRIHNLVKLCSFVLKILNKNHILTSITDRKSVANLPKKMFYNLNIDLVNDNVYTKFGSILSIRS